MVASTIHEAFTVRAPEYSPGVDTATPAAFLGHGSPMNAIETNRYTEAWRAFGASVRPRAILVVSAHWYVSVTAVTAMARPRTIHDFYGFPRPLFEVEYPAPGDPRVAEEVRDLLAPLSVGLDTDSWGLDHGAWSVLVHAFPKADVPVVQLAIDERQGPEFHFDVGARLAPLRARGVLVLASGNAVHNLRAIDWGRPDHAFDWARRFDEAAREVMTQRPADAPSLVRHPDYAQAAPTPEHFYPLLYVAGLASASRTTADVLVDGYAYGSLSMTAYTVGAASRHVAGGGPSGELPDPATTPPDATNI